MDRVKMQTVDDFNSEFDEPGDGAGVDLDLKDLLRTLRKHRWLILVFTALVTALAAYYVQTVTPQYKATSTLLIEPEQSGPVSFEGWVGLDNESADYYETQFQLLRSRDLALRVVRHMNLVDHPEFRSSSSNATADTVQSPSGVNNESADSSNSTWYGKVFSSLTDSASQVAAQEPVADSGFTSPASTPDEGSDWQGSSDGRASDAENLAVSRFLGRLTVVPVKRTKLVKISFESPDPEFAALVANTVGEQYIFAYLDSRMELSNKLSTWTNNQLVSLKEDLDNAEVRVLEFKQTNGLVDVNGSVQRLNEQEMSIYTNELATVRSELSDASDLRREIQSYNGDIRLLETVPAVQLDPIVRDIRIDMGQQQRELDELSNRYGPRHPIIVDATSRLDSLQRNLEVNIERVVASVDKEYTLLSQRLASVQSKLDQGKSDIQDLSAKNFRLANLEREVETKQAVYQQFFNRVTEANSTDGLETANARLADLAIAPRAPFKPKKQLIIALAAIGAFGLSVIMAFIYEQSDDTVRSASDVEKKLGVPMLGLLPLIKSGILGKKSDLPLNPKISDLTKKSFAESVNTVRSALVMRETPSPVGKVVLITSSIPNEGKSTTSINIAHSFSKLEKTVLIDLDLRRPSIAKALGLEKELPGVSNLLLRSASPKSCIQQNVLDDLDVICSGPIPEHPLELLSSSRMEKLLDQLRQHYDRIVLDCSPAQAVSDPLVLSKLADSIVFCVKSNSTASQIVGRALDRLKQVHARVDGVVMTQVDIDKLVSYAGDHYYQGYYDYYGYLDSSKSPDQRLKISQSELEAINQAEDDFEYDFDFPESGQRTTFHDDEDIMLVLDETLNLSEGGNGKPKSPVS